MACGSKRREIGLCRSTGHCKGDDKGSTGHYGIIDTAPESAWELGEGRGLGVGGQAEMVLKCPGHWRKNVVTTSLGVPSTVLMRNLQQSLLP